MRVAHSAVRPFAATSGTLLALSPAPFALAPDQLAVLAALPALCLFSAGLLIVQKPRLGRWLATFGCMALFGLTVPRLVQQPALALAAILAVLAALAGLWDVLGSPAGRRPLLSARGYGAATAALVFWVAASWMETPASLARTIPVGLAFLCAAVLGLRWAWAARRDHWRRVALLLACALAATLLAVLLRENPWAAASAGAVYAVGACAVLPRARRFDIAPLVWWEPFLGHPERLLVGTFLLLALGGTILLAFPLSAAGDAGIGILDAAFTAVSAVCVTGLIVLDTPVDFSPFGQAIILVLIQIGGLGIMTFSTAVLRVLGRRMSLRHEGAAASLINVRDRGQIARSARRILVLTFASETAGAIILFACFLAHGDTVPAALWRAVFTSISAFCNAGFAIQSDSLISYQSDPVVLHVVALLIILGGLSPITVQALPQLLRRSPSPAPVQAKLGLVTAAVLLVGGWLFLLVVEWDNTLRPLSWAGRVHNAWFQSVSLRTAGFNSLDFAQFHPASLTLSMIWMFIGGGPGGTAGGIKTTTAAVLLLSVLSIIRGSGRVTIFGRFLGERTRHRAAAVALLATCTAMAAVVALQLTQSMPGDEALFEVISALGTVGLSIGGTARLDEIGKVIIMGCMFAGRVGGLSLLMFVSRRGVPAPVKRPEEEIDVG